MVKKIRKKEGNEMLQNTKAFAKSFLMMAVASMD